MYRVKRERYSSPHLPLISIQNGNIWQNCTSSPKRGKNKLKNENTQTCMDPSCRIATVYFGTGLEWMRMRDGCLPACLLEMCALWGAAALTLSSSSSSRFQRTRTTQRARAWHATVRVRDYRLRHFLRTQYACKCSFFSGCATQTPLYYRISVVYS